MTESTGCCIDGQSIVTLQPEIKQVFLITNITGQSAMIDSGIVSLPL